MNLLKLIHLLTSSRFDSRSRHPLHKFTAHMDASAIWPISKHSKQLILLWRFILASIIVLLQYHSCVPCQHRTLCCLFFSDNDSMSAFLLLQISLAAHYDFNNHSNWWLKTSERSVGYNNFFLNLLTLITNWTSCMHNNSNNNNIVLQLEWILFIE